MFERAHKAIESLIKSLEAGGKRHTGLPERSTVTLSRSHAAGGREIAQRIADRLGLPLYDKTILYEVAKQANVSKQLLESLDDQLGQRRGMEWFYTLLTGENASLDLYRRHLFNVVLAVEQQGGVILGRGAHAILATHRVFRIRIAGSEHICARRLAEKEGLSQEEALVKLRQVNKARGDFLRAMFDRPVDLPMSFDMVMNTDRFADFDEVAEILLRSMAAQGYKVDIGPGR